jgi:hypothetical protein
MFAKKLPNGNLLVPFRAETGGVIGDGMKEVAPGTPEYDEWINFVLPDHPEKDSEKK